MGTVLVNERTSQSAFSTLSVNGITSCDSSIIVSFMNVMQMSFIYKWLVGPSGGSCVYLEGVG